MKVLVQRVSEASVSAGGECLARIGRGYLALFGVAAADTPEMADRMAKKLAELRIFEDGAGKTNRSIVDAGGEIIVVSQFTLYADTDHGRRPGFSAAARPETAIPVYERFVEALRGILGAEKVGTGRFGANMKVALVNDGPFTVELREEAK
ncbi:MAG: D-tyrosyl-tRNA(Tyr) deacylase [Kiritimatiellae bacterium]|nr:D-tyrosyl-tRNA(Tyr) deacylase [Kiritimatiellia bacterium]